ncbi:MAG TPA: PAS domain-containing protein, partial [Flavisolibacter sp.]|nr:PAS domain-containing protein [Flavisolibacter sp.]
DNKSIYEIGYGQWDIPQLHSLLETILPQKKSCFDFEISHNFQLIGERTMLLNAQEIIRKKGEDKLILLVIEDITEKKQHQLKVQGLLKKFQNLLMQAPVPICIFRSPQFYVELANEQMLQFWGREEEKVMGKPVFEAMPEVSGQGFEEFLRGVLTTGERFAQTEVPVNLMRGGKLENLFINLVCEALYEDDGTVSGVIAVVHEITPLVIARKRMEAQASMVQEMLMSAPGFVCILSGPNYVYELINEKYQSLFGKRKILGKPMLEALPELKGQGFDKLLDKVYNTGEPYVGIDMAINLARDEDQAPQLCYFNFSYQPMYDENRKINSILVFGYEVTEQVIATKKNFEHEQKLAKKLEEMVKQRTLELSEKNDELEKKNMELESFSYISSHDLQEPLRKVRTFASRILENESGALTEKGKDYFARIQSAIARMQTLIEDLLAYSHTNKAERKPEVVDLNQILEEVKTDLKESIEENGATIESNHLCGADINPSQFRQLLHNLIGN